MQACTKFNLLERAWTFGTGKENKQLVEVVIDTISMDFNIENDGDLVPTITYKIHTPLYGDDWYVSEPELFADLEDFKTAMEKLFEMRKFNYPKIMPNISSEFKEVA
jgi:hypothetical protein